MSGDDQEALQVEAQEMLDEMAQNLDLLIATQRKIVALPDYHRIHNLANWMHSLFRSPQNDGEPLYTDEELAVMLLLAVGRIVVPPSREGMS